MSLRTLFIIHMCATALAQSWFLTAGLGLGIHSSPLSTTQNKQQSQWQFSTSITSPLYEGLDGQLSYSLHRGLYLTDDVADDQLGIAFKAYVSRGRIFIHTGMGLGYHHRQNYTQDQTLNQAYVPFYVDIQFNHASFKPWRLSFESDTYIHSPNPNYLNGFNPILSKIAPAIHYHHKATEYILSYETARFSENIGIQGLNTQRIEAQIVYHFNHS